MVGGKNHTWSILGAHRGLCIESSASLGLQPSVRSSESGQSQGLWHGQVPPEQSRGLGPCQGGGFITSLYLCHRQAKSKPVWHPFTGQFRAAWSISLSSSWLSCFVDFHADSQP